ncbi:MAG: BMP family ABC transporter substrate-binding protein, partial [Rhizobiaceae bacterium]|nr:BMP family ABC transporter substrate-binding protein [Rhizobiaceae bacterium]
MKKTLLSLIALAAMSATALAADVKPALVYGTGGKFDKSFNEAAYAGAEKFKAETGIDYRDFEPTGDTQGEQAIRNFASKGYNPVVAVSFAWTSAIEKVAAEFPDTKFVIVDSVVDLPNVRSVVYKEEEGSYLVGILAGMASKTGKVGFVGGMDIPLIRKFECGYEQGARAANPSIQVLQNMTGTTGAAWNDPVRGGELTKNQIDQGADVIYAAAGATGLGVLQTAADNGKLSIGVDSNQNYLHPGSVLTSMVKRVDLAVYNAYSDAKGDKFSAGVQALGVKEDGVAYALDEHNAKLVTDDMKAAVEKAKADIIAGTVKVHDYMSDNSCPQLRSLR